MDIKGEKITRTQKVDDLFTGGDIGTWQADYLLREVDFERLKTGKPVTHYWAQSIGLTTFGFALNLVGKGYTNITVISKGEWIAFGSGIGFTVILLIIGIFVKDSRKDVMKKIQNHFDTAPTRKSMLGGRDE